MSTEVPTQFKLQSVLEVLLFSTSEPLSVKEIQGVFTRFHHEAEKVRGKLDLESEEGSSVMESRLPFPIELIDEVPSLVTSTQIRDAIEGINKKLEESEANYRIQETNSGFRLVGDSAFAGYLRAVTGSICRFARAYGRRRCGR